MSKLTLQPGRRALSSRDPVGGSTHEALLSQVMVTWHEQVAAAFRASRRHKPRSPRQPRIRTASVVGTKS